MADGHKTFKILCSHCQMPFHVRLALRNESSKGKKPGNPGSAPEADERVVNCLYCGKPVAIKIPPECDPDEGEGPTAIRGG